MDRTGDEYGTKPILFLDACFGDKTLADALRQDGYHVETHIALFAEGADDVVWIPEVAQRGWVILSKDTAMGRRGLEVAALTSSSAAAFLLTRASAGAESYIAAFRAALPRIERLLAKWTRPLVCKVSISGQVTVKIGSRRGGVRR